MAGPCRHCGAEWESRVANPIQCPRCCQRLAMPKKKRAGVVQGIEQGVPNSKVAGSSPAASPTFSTGVSIQRGIPKFKHPTPRCPLCRRDLEYDSIAELWICGNPRCKFQGSSEEEV